ncbi:MAG TPA: methyltransferase domain-containing protein [Polyangiales bacterium]|nr:methyltransferase domain-containing protein [Polyangiales bacterium]
MMPLETYTHGHHDSVLRSHRSRNVENSAAYLKPFLRPGSSVLDVGCGPATLTLDLALHVPGGRVVAIDRAEPVLDEARKTLAGREPAVSVSIGDVYALAFPDASFDIVHAHQVLQHLTDPVSALREMRRVCAPSGVVAVRDSDYGTFRWFPEDARIAAWLQLYFRVTESNRAFPDAGRRLVQWANAAGFREVTYSASVWSFATPEQRGWWADSWAQRVTESSFAEQALERGFATNNQLAEMAAGFRAWAAADGGTWTITHGEVIARA